MGFKGGLNGKSKYYMRNTKHIKEENFEITNKEKESLGSNAWHLARFIMEHDDVYAIPEGFNMGQFVVWAEKYPELTEEEEIKFIDQYLILEKLVKNVTARTLAATRIYGRGFFSAAFGTSVGRYLIFLTSLALLFSYFLFFGDYLIKHFDAVKPLFAAGLGTCVYLLRITQEKLKSREFDPANIPAQLVRLILGVVIGGILVKIFPSMTNSETVNSALSTYGFKENELILAIAFILGYAVEIFYKILDKLGGSTSKCKT